MAMTHDYLDYLNETIGIAPANSQEELQAAQTIAGLMAQHDVEPQIEEFDAPALSGVAGAVLTVVMFLGIILSGVGVLALTVVGFVLAVIPAVLALLRLFGRNVPTALGPSARSQNVIARHKATGPLVTKGNRTIVVVAHYDTPHENFLYSSAISPYLPLVAKVARWCTFAVAVCALIQIMGFIPEGGRLFFWVIGILAAVPGMVLAAGSISERMTPCTLGANDNKSSVAALLGVLENVRPSGAVPKPRPVVVPEPEPEEELPAEDAATDDVAAAAEEPVPVTEQVLGVRHGEEVLRGLGMLPEDCEIEYVGAAAVQPAAAPAAPAAPVDVPAEPSAGATAPLAAVDAIPSEELSAASTSDLEATREHLLSTTGNLSLVMDDEPRGIGEKDSSGLTNTEAVDHELDATRPAEPAPRPEAPNDPEWGKSSFRPQLSSVARRASLFDLPDPSATGVDPFGVEEGATRVQRPTKVTPDAERAVEAPQPVSTLSSESSAEGDKPKASALSGFFSRIKEKISSASEKAPEDEKDAENSWLGDDDSDGLWRGGATTRSGLRLVGEDEAVDAETPVDASDVAADDADAEDVDTADAEVPSEEDLQDAVLSLVDDELVSHDIWFVALGASSLGHAGMASFLAKHRSEIRGSFVVNLDCVGAGDLSVITHEGLEGTRRADRRLARLLNSSANDLHVSLDQKKLDWTETDVTPAMHSSLRSVTLMGVGENGLPALSRTGEDVPEAVSGDQAAHVAQIVTEMIRRS